MDDARGVGVVVAKILTIQPDGCQPQAASIIQVTEPNMTAITQKAPDCTRSMSQPETMEAVVQENNRNAAQNTPLSRAHRAVSAAVRPALAGLPPMCVAISSFQGVAKAATMSPTGQPLTIAE